MKKAIKKWMLRLAVTAILVILLLLVIIFNPAISYANKTTQNNCTIFHHEPVDQVLKLRVAEALQLTEKSEYYNSRLKLDICLNDGSAYPGIMHTIRGDAFAWGFYNKVVLMGNADYKKNYVELNGYHWNLTELLAHEMMHCFQFNELGLWKSNPVAKIATWKWEGYPEYVARQNNDQKELAKNIDRLIQTGKKDNNGWIQFSDSTGTVITYYKYWLLIQYSIDIKKLSYAQIIADTTQEATITQEMMKWYQKNKNTVGTFTIKNKQAPAYAEAW